jgi:hypothetical protein
MIGTSSAGARNVYVYRDSIFNTTCVIGRKTCCFNGKIRMRLAASATPVAVKRRAVEPVNKV